MESRYSGGVSPSSRAERINSTEAGGGGTRWQQQSLNTQALTGCGCDLLRELKLVPPLKKHSALREEAEVGS